MSNITLYNVEGINREDTLYFSSKDEQEQFFDNNALERIIQDSFFPPYYTNKIKLSSDDIDFNSYFNYVSLEYGNKRYYYFIDKVEYVSESIMTIFISMDTIQTFMFDIHTNYAIVERMFIDRFVTGNTINRKYIRENFSSENFYRIYNKEYSSPADFNDIPNSDYLQSDGLGVLVFRCASTLKEDPSVDKIVLDRPAAYAYEGSKDNSEQTSYVGQYYDYILPLSKYILTHPSAGIHFVDINEPSSSGEMSTSLKSTIYWLSRQTAVQSVYYLRFNPFPNHIVPFANGIYYNPVAFEVFSRTIPMITDDGDGYFDVKLLVQKTNTILRLYKYHDIIDLTKYFVRNENKEVSYSSKYLPVLFDENYFRVNFGNLKFTTSLPSYKVTSLDNIYNYMVSDITSGGSYFWFEYRTDITYSYIDGFFNPYDLNAFDSNVVFYDLVSDAWNDYVAYNKFSLSSAFLQDGINIAKSLYKVNVDADLINSAREAYTTAYNEGDIGETTWANYYGQQVRANDPMYNSNTPSALLNEATRAGNAQYAPSSIKQLGTMFSSLINKIKTPHYYIEEVQDFEKVAYYYHLYGYKVNIPYINTSSNLFTEVKNRYYFNYIKCKEIDFHLSVLQSQVILDDIRRRYLNGIRLWNSEVLPIGNAYKYDNVELKYLS